MLEAAFAALRQILTPPFRSVLWKSLGLTLLLLALIWAGLDRLALSMVVVDHPLMHSILAFATGFGIIFGLAFLVGPVSIFVAGFFIDDLAAIVEREIYPAGRQGTPAHHVEALRSAIRFSFVSLGVNLVALMLLLVPGINVMAFFLANAYLFGREYFMLAAMRFRSSLEAEEIRRVNALTLFIGGLFIAIFVATPGLNLLTPLFATAFMVRLHKKLSPDLATA
ncbi:MAG: sulfate transporter family protein [Methylocystis sp.]